MQQLILPNTNIENQTLAYLLMFLMQGCYKIKNFHTPILDKNESVTNIFHQIKTIIFQSTVYKFITVDIPLLQ